jgi:ribose 1,5-bisphosphokinase
VIAELRCRYADVRVVIVTAPADVLAARIAARGRATDRALATRLTRSAPARRAPAPDVVIENVGDLQDGAKAVVAISCST